jgi:hypothetical protein
MSNLLEKASIVLTPTAYSDGALHSVKPLQTLGSELVRNGDFATDSAWGKGTGWTISGGAGNANLASGNLGQTGYSFVINKTYKVTYEVKNYVNGNVRFQLTGGATLNGNTVNSNGIYTQYIKATANHTNFRFNPTSFTGSIDNASVKEVIDADFDFTRSTTATRENSSGNIESVAANLPRIDYLGGTGHILLEPQSTNTATYSNDFTQGSIFDSSNAPSVNAVLTSQQATSPDGTNNAWLLKDNNSGGTGVVALRYFDTNVTSNDFNTISIFVKKALANDFILLKSGGFDTNGNGSTWFNINDGTLGNVSGSHTAKIEDYGSGFYRCSITFKSITDVAGSIQLQLASTNGSDQVTKDGTNGVYIFGIQCEADASRNFATSYIPTSGTTVTRSADAANNSGSSDLINSTEGVLYAEIAALSEGQSVTTLTISDGSLSNRVLIALTTGELKGQFVSSANNINKTTSGVTIEEFNKIACSYTSTTFKVFVNGTQLGTTSTSLTAVTGLNELAFDRGDGGLDLLGKVKCVAVFKEALTDEELTCLTT